MAPRRLLRPSVSFTPYYSIAIKASMSHCAVQSSSPVRPEASALSLSSMPNSPTTHNRSRIDDASFLSSDLDVSFASVSVDSPPCTPIEEHDQSEAITSDQHLIQDSPSLNAMDISPAILRSQSRGPTSTSTMPVRRHRSNTIGAQRLIFAKASNAPQVREFGRELSNSSRHNASPDSPPAAPIIKRSINATPIDPPVPALLEPASSGTTKHTSARRRAGLPTMWMPDGKQTTIRGKRAGGLFAGQVQFDLAESSPERSHCLDAMEIDRSMNVASRDLATSSPTHVVVEESNDLGTLFFESNSPPAASSVVSRRRRSDEWNQENQSPIDLQIRKDSGGSRRVNRSSSPGSSPSAHRTALAPIAPARKLERFATTGAASVGGLFGGSLGKAAGRPPPMKRPAINALIPTEDAEGTISAPKSAYAGLYGPNSKRVPSTMSAMPVPRRAISAQVPPPLTLNMAGLKYDVLSESEDGETEPEDDSLLGRKAVIVSPVVAAGRRRAAMNGRSVSYRQGPMTAAPGGSIGSTIELALASAVLMREESDAEMMNSSQGYCAGGLPGSRDTETRGKILPCHKVKEDGIVRITPSTMEELLAGSYDDKLKEFHVIDCRFDYEFNGGHIEGATNLTTPEAVSEFFLKEVVPPTPTESGDRMPTDELKTIIIFHCEFSAKRGPTFAKHLRAQDRKTCQYVYPKVHYPEVYILEGGYKAYYEAFPARCQGYTKMDDPEHLEARRERMDHLRRWERTRSYTYGERTAAVAALSEPTSAVAEKNPVVVRPASMGNAFGKGTSSSALTLGRRGAAAATVALSTLEEHDDTSLTEGDSACSGAGHGSPCPPQMTKTSFATLKPAIKRAPFDRAATFGRLNFAGASQ